MRRLTLLSAPCNTFRQIEATAARGREADRVGVWYVLTLLLGAAPLRAFRLPPAVVQRLAVPARLRAAVATLAAVVIVVAYLGYLAVFDRAVASFRPLSFASYLPIPLLGGGPAQRTTDAQADQLLLLAIVQACALAALVSHLDAFGALARRACVAGIAAFLAVSSLFGHAADSRDIYSYVGLGELGMRGYAPPATPFAGDLIAVNHLWGQPMLPSAYGPVWLVISHVTLAPFPALAQKLAVLKLIGLGSIAACALLARGLGSSRTIVALLACNPALYELYAVNAHNDLLGADLVLAAMLAMRRSEAAGIALALAAALTKLSLLPVALLVAAREPLLPRRLRFAAVLAASLAAAYALGNGMLWRAAVIVTQHYPSGAPVGEMVLHVAAALLAIGAGIAALGRGRVRAQAAWAMPALGQSAWPWYLGWGIPFALASEAVAWPFLVTLPVAAFALSAVFPDTAFYEAVRFVALVGPIAVVAYQMRPST